MHQILLGEQFCKCLIFGGRYWDRTSSPRRVKAAATSRAAKGL